MLETLLARVVKETNGTYWNTSTALRKYGGDLCVCDIQIKI